MRGVLVGCVVNRMRSATSGAKAMPRVAKIGPYRFLFFANENAEPPRIHGERGDAEAKFRLETVDLADADGFRAHELTRIEQLVREHRERFPEAWHAFFGR